MGQKDCGHWVEIHLYYYHCGHWVEIHLYYYHEIVK
jgi:hypothetical protein